MSVAAIILEEYGFFMVLIGIVLLILGIWKYDKIKAAKIKMKNDEIKAKINKEIMFSKIDELLDYTATDEYNKLQKLAKMNVTADSHYSLGNLFYRHGFYKLAMKWYNRGSVLGCERCQCCLGEMYCSGQGVEMESETENNDRGMYWLNIAVKKGSKRAEGFLYEKRIQETKAYFKKQIKAGAI